MLTASSVIPPFHSAFGAQFPPPASTPILSVPSPTVSNTTNLVGFSLSVPEKLLTGPQTISILPSLSKSAAATAGQVF